MSNMHIADALEQGIFDIEDGCAKTMCAPHSVMKQGAGLIRLHEQQAKQLEAERDAALAALKVAREALNKIGRAHVNSSHSQQSRMPSSA